MTNNPNDDPITGIPVVYRVPLCCSWTTFPTMAEARDDVKRFVTEAIGIEAVEHPYGAPHV
ncbi:MAG: hypothetical protein HC828_01950 [Blastochloris sp.]|nr:hypothetical protein [Blastochloris sp.]